MYFFTADEHMSHAKVHEIDLQKEKIMVELGYKYITIWSKEYKSNKEEMFNKIMEKIYE